QQVDPGRDVEHQRRADQVERQDPVENGLHDSRSYFTPRAKPPKDERKRDNGLTLQRLRLVARPRNGPGWIAGNQTGARNRSAPGKMTWIQSEARSSQASRAADF